MYMLMDVCICIYTFVFTDLKRKRDILLREYVRVEEGFPAELRGGLGTVSGVPPRYIWYRGCGAGTIGGC